MEFDEEYRGKRFITANSHILHQFTAKDGAVDHRIVISEVEAPGFLGFFYRKFGSSNIGNALLRSYKTFLESLDE